MSWLADWNAFWFTPQTTRILSLYRIGLGVVVLVSIAWRLPFIDVFYSDAGLISFETVRQARGFTPPSLLMFGSEPLMVQVCFAFFALAALCFTAGFAIRCSSIALFVLGASFHVRNALVHNSGDAAIVAMLFLFMFAPADQVYSVDRWLRQRRSAEPLPEPHVAAWVQRAMQCQIALLWLMAGFHKAHGTLWYSGTAMYYVFGQVGFAAAGVETLMNYPLIYTTLTFATVFTELAIPFLLWFRASRRYAVAMVLGIQLWILCFMTLPVFPLFTIVTTVLFYDEDQLRWPAWLRVPRGRAVAARC
ncbi:MAG TPA: HTTM domain-containing protein [Terriglobales bacterium]|nr:HTTM domain-containing protein [Terriglobales bacterium]